MAKDSASALLQVMAAIPVTEGVRRSVDGVWLDAPLPSERSAVHTLIDTLRCRPSVLAEGIVRGPTGCECGRVRVLLPGDLSDPEEETSCVYGKVFGHPWAAQDACRLVAAHSQLGVGSVELVRGPLGQTTRLAVHGVANPGPGWLAACIWHDSSSMGGIPPSHWELFMLELGVWWSPELLAAVAAERSG